MATGVNSAADEATATHISTAMGLIEASAAIDSDIGMIINAVAVLLISWPRTAVTAKSREKQQGPEPPMAATMSSAMIRLSLSG